MFRLLKPATCLIWIAASVPADATAQSELPLEYAPYKIDAYLAVEGSVHRANLAALRKRLENLASAQIGSAWRFRAHPAKGWLQAEIFTGLAGTSETRLRFFSCSSALEPLSPFLCVFQLATVGRGRKHQGPPKFVDGIQAFASPHFQAYNAQQHQ